METESGVRGFTSHVVSISRHDEQSVVDGTTWYSYDLDLKSWFSLLRYTNDYRVYRKVSVKGLIEEVLKRHAGIAEYQFRLSGSYNSIEFQVQYNESDYDFIVRKMAQHGLYTYYEHDATSKKQTLIITDNKVKHQPIKGSSTLRYHPQSSNPGRDEETVYAWSRTTNFDSGKSLIKDFNYEKSRTKLESKDDQAGQLKQKGAPHQMVYFPAGFDEPSAGNKLARLRTESQLADNCYYLGSCKVRNTVSGALFTLANHPDSAMNKEYLTVSANYSFSMADFRSGGSSGSEFDCSFHAIEQSVQYRPPVGGRSATSLIHGVQTATVTGPSGTEIHTDALGRVTLKFHWDRSEHNDENSSDWIRVSNPHAGRSFGALSIPRVGEEVLVEFENGDPEFPVVVGRLYNDFNKTPVDLPAKKMLSGVKTNSTTGGGGYHELWFDDSKGSEMFSVFSQKDMTLEVKNDVSSEIGNDEERKVGNNQKLAVSGNQEANVSNSSKYDVGTTYDVKAGSSIKITSNMDIKLEASGSSIEIGPAGVTIKTGGMVQVQGSMIKLN
jgi:type VI secretion system secreted protein VgrG